MKMKHFISEPVIIAFVAFIDLASIFAIFLCHQDVTRKEAQAAIETEVHEAVSSRTVPPSAEMTHYSPAAINSMLHPATDGKFLDISHRISASSKNR